MSKSTDPYPVGGVSEPVASIPLRKTGRLNMAMVQPMLDAESDKGTKVEVLAGFDGTIRFWVTKADGSRGDRYVIDTRDVVQVILDEVEGGSTGGQ